MVDVEKLRDSCDVRTQLRRIDLAYTRIEDLEKLLGYIAEAAPSHYGGFKNFEPIKDELAFQKRVTLMRLEEVDPQALGSYLTFHPECEALVQNPLNTTRAE